MTFDLIEVIFYGIILIFLGWKLREYAAMRMLKAYFKSVEKIESKPEPEILYLDIHKEDGQFYVFNSKTKSFLIQVKTKDELMTFLNKKFPDKTVLTSQSEMELFDTL